MYRMCVRLFPFLHLSLFRCADVHKLTVEIYHSYVRSRILYVHNRDNVLLFFSSLLVLPRRCCCCCGCMYISHFQLASSLERSIGSFGSIQRLSRQFKYKQTTVNGAEAPCVYLCVHEPNK